ncbi:unnamed protein product [Rotaria sp. Silwood1]|nr:unnamed protein product [Rotaria sp. Silwood1]CAF0958528.1 unnamed protein product [Rotaria sp. Silwood1]CAF3370640.1 unnamed protein product [Rotaria sp. Silwood1]CAF3374567.1 unnamed protein product [Rotaria sp. Silwood1]CAF3379667.1 unnamed protein product [Rotaria sp. Silwood1]
MQYCSSQCFHRAFYAILIGISPIVTCLLLLGLIRIILHCLETACYRRQKAYDRRRSSSFFYQGDRPTLLYTPVSFAELQRIIQGEYQSEQQNESLSLSIPNDDNDTIKATKFMKSILSRRESSSPNSTNTIANLVIRRNAIGTIPFTALFASVSTPATPTFDMINEQKTRRPSFMRIKQESSEKTTLTAVNNDNYRLNRLDSSESDPVETDPLFRPPMRTMSSTTTAIIEESREFHSAQSIPYAFN